LLGLNGSGNNSSLSNGFSLGLNSLSKGFLFNGSGNGILACFIIHLLSSLNVFYIARRISTIVFTEYFPSSGAHETLGLFSTCGTKLSHFTARDKFEVFRVRSGGVKEFHFVRYSVEGSNLEREHFNSIEISLVMHKELLSVPSIVKVGSFLGGVTNTSGVSSGNEVSDSRSDSGRGVP